MEDLPVAEGDAPSLMDDLPREADTSVSTLDGEAIYAGRGRHACLEVQGDLDAVLGGLDKR